MYDLSLEIWAIRVRLQLASRTRDLALLNLAIDSKLRGCDPVSLHVRDVCNGDGILQRAAAIQQKTGRPVQFEITIQTRSTLDAWITRARLQRDDYLWAVQLLLGHTKLESTVR